MLDTLNLETLLSRVQQIYELQHAIINIFGEGDVKHHLIKKDKKCSQNQAVWSTPGFYPQGILELSIKHKYYPHSITLEATYKPVLITRKKQNQASLSVMNDYQAAVNGFNYFIDILNAELNSFQLPPVIYWDVSRVDYAYQYATPFYECLMYILNKGYALAENLGYKDSAYLVNAYRNINIYDKTVQQHLPAIGGEHLLRFEIQCKRKALARMAERYHWERISIYHIWDENVAKDTVINTVKMLVGKHDFFNLHMAEQIVHSNFQAKKAGNIMDYLKATRYNKAKLKSLLSGKMDGYSNDYIRRSIRPALNKVGIAPVLIPDCYHVSIIENPIVQLMQL